MKSNHIHLIAAAASLLLLGVGENSSAQAKSQPPSSHTSSMSRPETSRAHATTTRSEPPRARATTTSTKSTSSNPPKNVDLYKPLPRTADPLPVKDPPVKDIYTWRIKGVDASLREPTIEKPVQRTTVSPHYDPKSPGVTLTVPTE